MFTYGPLWPSNIFINHVFLLQNGRRGESQTDS